MFVIEDMVTNAIKKMKQGKAGKPSAVIIAELSKIGGKRHSICNMRACELNHI